jgi:hypothetical protein
MGYEMIDIKKKYRTRNGETVTLISDQGRSGDLKIIGYIDAETALTFWKSDGKFSKDSVYCEIDLIEVGQYDDFKKDDPVIVSNGGPEWHCWRRYFSHVDLDGLPCTFNDGRTSWVASQKDTTAWTTCRKPTAEELK